MSKKFCHSKHKFVCHFVDYGMLILNFNKFNPDEEENDENRNKDRVAGYFIMSKYSENLDQYIERQKSKIDFETVLKITHQLVDAFEIVHATRRTFNDLKPENIMVEHDENGELYIVLIDFGFSAKYYTEEGFHISEEESHENF